MRTPIRIGIACLICIAIAWTLVLAMTGPGPETSRRPLPVARESRSAPAERAPERERPGDLPSIPLYGDWFLNDSGYALGYAFTADSNGVSLYHM